MIFGRLFNHKKPSSRGDTIVEVLISVAILALVLATAYVAASNSLRTGTSAGQRNQALGYAQSQIEYIKQLQSGMSTTNGTLATITDGSGDFCFTSTGDLIDELDKTNPPWPEEIRRACLSYDNQTYSVRAKYDFSLMVFTIRVSWSCASTSAEDCSLTLYYKLPGNGSGGGGGGEDTPPTVNLTASPTAVQVNGSSNLTWVSTNTTSCSASIDWMGPRATNGGEPTGSLTTVRLYTYVLTCNGPGGQATDTATVNVTTDPPPPGGGGCISTGGIAPKPGNTQANPCIRAFNHLGGGTFFWDMDHCYVGTVITHPGGSSGTSWVDDSNENGTTSTGQSSGEFTLYCNGGDAGATWMTRNVGGGPPPPPPPQTEVCDGEDNDGDGEVDEVCAIQTGCLWGDGTWDDGASPMLCVPDNDPDALYGTACIQLPATFIKWGSSCGG